MLLFKRLQKKAPEARHASQNPEILNVNLIKDEIGVSFDWNKNLSILAIVIFIAGLLIVEVYFGLSWWEEQEISNSQQISASLAQVNSEIAKLKSQADEAVAYKDKSVIVDDLLNNHVYWSNLFSWLEQNTLSSVTYGGFGGDLSGSYTLNATAKTLADVSWQTKAFLNSPWTLQASVAKAEVLTDKKQGGTGAVNFNLDLKVKPAIFKK